MASGKISGDPLATTTVGLSMAAIQGGANVQAPSDLFASVANNLSDLASPATALTNLGGLSSALAASTYLTQAAAVAGYQPLDADLTSWAGVTRAAGFDTFAATPSSANLAALVTGETGTGALVFGTSPTLTTPALGTPTALVLTSATGTPTSIGLANGTGLPVATGISGLGAGVATFLATPSSANLATAVTGDTGTGALVFGTAPTLDTPTVTTRIEPTTDDGAPLGTTSKKWSDAFFADGAVLNFNAGNYTVTHSTGKLSLSGVSAFLGNVGVGPNTGSPAERLAVGYGENIDMSFGSATSMKSYVGTFQDDVVIASNRRPSDGSYASASFPTAQIAIRQASGDAQIKFGTSTTNGSGTATDRMNITGAGLITVLGGSFGRAAPVTKTADFTVAATENWLINNKAAATCTVTLPAAASWTGREIMIKNLQAFTVVSASSNVVPLAGGAAAAAILSANAGRWCTLVSDGTNWVIMNGVI